MMPPAAYRFPNGAEQYVSAISRMHTKQTTWIQLHYVPNSLALSRHHVDVAAAECTNKHPSIIEHSHGRRSGTGK